MAKIFISYSRVDKAFAERFDARLRRMFPDVNVWYDDHLYGGQDWWQEILGHIAKCDIFIYLLSNESVTSPYCEAEFTEARRLQKRIITVQVRDRTALTDDLDDIQYVDMKNGVDDADAVARLGGAVRLQLANVSRKRPLWQPITPKPLIPDEQTRSSDVPEVDTPALNVQHPIVPPRGREKFPLREIGIGLFVTIVGVQFSFYSNP